jgi:hypothetical protein
MHTLVTFAFLSKFQTCWQQIHNMIHYRIHPSIHPSIGLHAKLDGSAASSHKQSTVDFTTVQAFWEPHCSFSILQADHPTAATRVCYCCILLAVVTICYKATAHHCVTPTSVTRPSNISLYIISLYASIFAQVLTATATAFADLITRPSNSQPG